MQALWSRVGRGLVGQGPAQWRLCAGEPVVARRGNPVSLLKRPSSCADANRLHPTGSFMPQCDGLVEHCNACTAKGKCTACQDGFHLSGGKCVPCDRVDPLCEYWESTPVCSKRCARCTPSGPNNTATYLDWNGRCRQVTPMPAVTGACLAARRAWPKPTPHLCRFTRPPMHARVHPIPTLHPLHSLVFAAKGKGKGGEEPPQA